MALRRVTETKFNTIYVTSVRIAVTNYSILTKNFKYEMELELKHFNV